MKFQSSVFLAAAFVVVIPIVATAATPGVTPPTVDHREFVVSSCAVTLYPDVCLSTLARHADVICDDPARLARTAVYVSLKEVQKFSASLTNLSRNASGAAKSALAVCVENMASAGSAMSDSLGKMRQIIRGNTAGKNLRVAMNGVKTLMRSAMTSEETCSDGFEGVGDGSSYVETEVRHGVNLAWMVTSNALALIKYYVNDQTSA